MKYTKLELKDFHQFKNVVIDLTYPAGHEKAGQPLEKVCIIGQSGTGKTTLLKILKGFQFSLDELKEEYEIEKFPNQIICTFCFNDLTGQKTFGFGDDDTLNEDLTYIWYESTLKLKGEEVTFEQAVEVNKQMKSDIVTKTIYLPADTNVTQANFIPSDKPFNKSKKHFDFGKINIGDTWHKVLGEIQEHQEKEIIIRQAISKLVEEGAGTTEIDTALDKLREIKKKEVNPLKRIAEECLDPILKHFNLRVKTELDFQKKDDIGFIKIEDLQGN